MSLERTRNRVLISTWLKREGFTLNQLVAQCGFPRQTIQAIKAGRDVRLSTMAKILRGARALAKRRVGVEELFDFEDHKHDPNGSGRDTNSQR